MRGSILWIGVALAAVMTGVGLYAVALQTPPPTTVANTPADSPAAAAPSQTPGPDGSSGPASWSPGPGPVLVPDNDGSDDHGVSDAVERSDHDDN